MVKTLVGTNQVIYFVLVNTLRSLQSVLEIRTRKCQKHKATVGLIPRHGAELSPGCQRWRRCLGLGARGSHASAAAHLGLQGTRGHAALMLSLRLALGVMCISSGDVTPPAIGSGLANLAPTQLLASALALLVGSMGQGSRNGLFPFQHRQKRCGGAASPIYTTTAEAAPCSFPCFGAGDVKRSPGTPKLMKKVLVLPTRG